MTTKKKIKKREAKKILDNCWDLDCHLMEYITKHLVVIEKHICGSPNIEVFKTDAEWKSAISDMVYFTSNYNTYCSGKPVDQKAVDAFVKDGAKINQLEDGSIDFSNVPKFVYKLDAIEDKKRYLRGRKYLLKYFSNLWL